jgi:hypothetical protein
MRIRTALSTGLLACPPLAPAVAQSSVPAIPAPLVSALLAGNRGAARATPTFYVSELPTGFPTALIPAGPVRIVGGMRSDGELVVVLADSTRRLAAVFEQTIQEAGFKHPPTDPGAGFSGGGGPYRYFCRDSTTVSVEPLAGAERDFIRVAYRVGRTATSCVPMPPRESHGVLKLPPMTAPAGMQAMSSGGGSGTSEVTSSAELSGGGLNAAVIVAHYAAQLRTSGFTVGTPADGSQVSSRYLEATDAQGGRWRGAMIAFESGTSVSISLMMRPIAAGGRGVFR